MSYQKANEKSQQFFARAQRVAPGGVHSPVRAFKSVGGSPLFFASAEGAYLTSVDGQRYIDFCQSFGPNLLGHRDPEVLSEVHKAVDTAWSFGACEPYSLELAEWMIERLPWLERLRFVNSGTEAVMSALRVARAATGRQKILKFDGCYHGHVDQMLVQAGSGLAGEASSSSAGVSQEQAENTLVASLDDENSVREIFARHGQDIAAVIIEPLPANYGLLLQRADFLHELQAISKKHGALFILDEVISGFRAGLGGMCEKLKMKPDLVVYGKVIGGGFPVGCYGGRADLLDLVAPAGPVYQAGTLSANPVGMRAGLATLKKAQRDDVFTVLRKRTENWVSQVNEIFHSHHVPLTMISEESLFWIHGANDGKVIRRLAQIPANQSAQFAKLFQRLLQNGVYLAPSGYEVGFLSLAHSEAVLNEALAAFHEACRGEWA